MPDWIQSGPRDAKIIIVGEAPGPTEVATGRPFEGYSGELLGRMLSRVGLSKADCFVTNVCHVSPGKADFSWFSKKENQIHLLRGMLRLKSDIEAIRPNLVLGLGSNPLKVLTGRTGIDKWRGSVLESSLVKKQKVLCTYHPAYILRAYDYKAVAEFDLAKAARISSTPSIELPVRDHYFWSNRVIRRQNLDGSLTDREGSYNEFEAIFQRMLHAGWLGVDIECWLDEVSGKWKLACVGFSDQADTSLVIHNEGPESRGLFQQLLASPSAKVFQNGTFDCTVLQDEGYRVENFAWDTMLAHHALYAECASGSDELAALGGKKRSAAIQKGLAFQASLYTDEPFYKDDGKLWKESGDLKTFWLYNGRDVAVTREIRDVHERELDEFGVRQVFDHEQSLVAPLMKMTRRGVRIDLAQRAALHKQIETEIANLQSMLDAVAGHSVNVKSSPQVKKLLYDELKLPAKRSRKTGNETADKDAINELAAKYSHPALHAILKIRERRDIIERYLNATVDADGRMRCSFDITGTRSGRLSSRASIYGSGTNLQNIPSRKKVGEQIKRMFIADKGKVFILRDYKQAEAWIVAYLARCEGLIELLNDPTRDIHKENASRIFNKPVDQITPEERYLAKRVVHACNYGMAADKFVRVVAEDAEATGVRVDYRTAQKLIDKYFAIYPEIKENFWRQVEEDLRYKRMLNTPFGRKRIFYGRMDDKLVREGYSYIPQSTVGWLGCEAVVRIDAQVEVGMPETGTELLLQVHDSVLAQSEISHAPTVITAMERAMDIPVTIDGRTFSIPTDCQVGVNWSKRSSDNPTGLVDFEKGGREWLMELAHAP